MSQQKPSNQKLITTVTLLILLTSLTASADIEFGQDNNLQALEEQTVWMNHDQDPRQATLTCSGQNNITEVSIDGNSFGVEDNQSEWVLDFGDLKNNISGAPGKHSLSLDCENEDEATAEIYSERIEDVSIDKGGKGFVGGDLSSDAYGNTNPANLEIELKNGGQDIADLIGSDQSNFNIITSDLQIGSGDVRISGQEDNKERTEYRLTPSVYGYLSSGQDFEIYDNQGNLAYSTENDQGGGLNPEIYSYSVDIVSSPERKVDFESVSAGDYNYILEITDDEGSGENIVGSDFEITIERFNNGWKDIHTDKEWLDWDPTSGNNPNEYNVYIENMNEINDLKDGLYRFTLEFEKEDEIIVDRIQVDKGTVFSGRVQKASGEGVKTEFFLDGERSVTIQSEENGEYSKEIEAGIFDYAEAEFYDTSREAYDSKIFIDNPDLSKETDLRGSGETSVMYQYWSNPDNVLSGVDPVNMFAVNFGYDMEGVNEIWTKFDSSNVDIDEIQVFECSNWNFAAQKCDDKWSDPLEKGEEFSIDRSTFPNEVRIKDISLYENPEDGNNILNNAYIIGTAANIELKDEFTISGLKDGKMPVNSTIGLEGGIVDEYGNNLENGYNVTVTLNGPDTKTFETSTDSSGEFRAEGLSPAETGSYTINVKASPEGYGNMDTDLENPLEVFRDTSAELEVPRTFETTQGEEETVEISVENNGQRTLEEITLTHSGMDSTIYSFGQTSFESLSPGDTANTEINVEIPEAFEDSYPSLDISLTATDTEGTRIEEQENIQFQPAGDTEPPSTNTSENETNNQTENTSEDAESQEDDEGTSWMPSASPMQATGDFVENQSSLNMALGLITVFLFILAVAVKRDKSNGSGGSRNAGRGRPSSMSGANAAAATSKVKPQDDSENTEQSEISAESSQETGDVVTAEAGGDSFTCEETGESFETREGLEMYREMKGIK